MGCTTIIKKIGMSKSCWRLVEQALQDIYESEGWGLSSPESKMALKSLEEKKRKLLEEREAAWHLKSRATWLSNGDENTKFFHAYAKGQKATNTIWSLKNYEGRTVIIFC
jgi:hypothetical protein